MEAANSMTSPPQVLYNLFQISLPFSIGSQQMSQEGIENDAATLGQYLQRLTTPELSARRRNVSEKTGGFSVTVRCTNNFQITTMYMLRAHYSPSCPCFSMITGSKKLHQKS